MKTRVTSGTRVAGYDQAHCRALAVYAVPDSVPDVVPYYADLDASGRAQGEALLRFVQAVVADSRARVARFPQNKVVEVHGGNHFIFLQRAVEVARAMRAFLSGVRPASSESGQPARLTLAPTPAFAASRRR